ncbi:MAG: hypothetical protein JJE22_12120 [Bacteroidia bacterium]|nr:hypothetical protein [Bacteroidia bacterium]
MYDSFNINLKSFKLTILLLAFPLFFLGQTLTGLWTGILTNDSNSVRKDQSFEIALTEYRGKVYGYSRSEFIVNDTLYYILKRVKGTINGNTCEVIDDDIISFNFPQKIDKGVKVYSTFYRNKKDSTWYLAGSWKTNKTKKYYAVTGKVDMKEEKDLEASKIFPHLEELSLANDIPFYKDRKKETDTYLVKTLEPEKSEATSDASTLIANISTKTEESNPLSTSSIEDIQINTAPKKPGDITPIAKTITDTQTEPIKTIPLFPIKESSINNKLTQENLAQTNKKIPNTLTGDIVQINQSKNQDLASQKIKKDVVITKTEQPQIIKAPLVNENKPEIKKSENTITATGNKVISTPNSDVEKKEIKNEVATITTNIKKEDIAEANTAATLIKERKSEFSQIVNFKSDSLELALYDNGEIDGDTVSVLLNGEIIIAKQCLKASAFKKTIYITPGNDEEFTMVMYAENLGKYPPNTGLLVIHDRDDVYNVHFSADFQKNAGVIFRRKK